MAASSIEITERDGVAIVRLRRPPANALDITLLDAIEASLGALERRADLRAMVLTGFGPVFSAGLDLKLVPTYDRAQQNLLLDVLNRALFRLYAMPVPTVAAINGHAIAGGLVLALACDKRVAVGSDALLGLTEVQVGVPFPVAAMAIVKAELAPAVARELVLGGRNRTSTEAAILGIVDELQPASTLLARSEALARELAGSPRQSYGVIKRQLRRDALTEIERALAGKDPLRDNWLFEETGAAAAQVLRRG